MRLLSSLLRFARRRGWSRLERICTYWGAEIEPETEIRDSKAAQQQADEPNLFYNQLGSKVRIIALAIVQLGFIALGVPIIARLFNDEKTSRDVFLTGALAILYTVASGPIMRLTQAVRRFLPAAFSDANYLKYGEIADKFQKMRGKLRHDHVTRIEFLLNATEKLFNNPTTKNVATNEKQIQANLAILEAIFDYVIDPPPLLSREKLTSAEIATETDRICKELEPYLKSLEENEDDECKYSMRDIFEEEVLEQLLPRVLSNTKVITTISNLFLYSPNPSTGKTTLVRALVAAINGGETKKPRILLFEPELGDYIPPKSSFQPGVDISFNENSLSIFAQAYVAARKAGVRDVIMLLDELPDNLGEKIKEAKKDKPAKRKDKDKDAAIQVQEDDAEEDLAAMILGFNKPAQGAALKANLKSSLNKQVTEISDKYIGITIYTDEGESVNITCMATGNKPLEPALASRFVTITCKTPVIETMIVVVLEDLKKEIARRKKLDMHVPEIDITSAKIKEDIKKAILVTKLTYAAEPEIITRRVSPRIIRQFLGAEALRPVLTGTFLGKRAAARARKREVAEQRVTRDAQVIKDSQSINTEGASHLALGTAPQ